MKFDLDVSVQSIVDGVVAEYVTPSAVKKAKARVKAGERAYRVARELMDDDDLDEVLEDLNDQIYTAIEDAIFDRIAS